MVVWVNHYSSSTDGLLSATMDPDSTGFQPPVPVDLDIGQTTGTYPSIAMNDSGETLVGYRVITAVSGPSTPSVPPGYVLDEIRMSRYNGQYWSSFGQPLNRTVAQAVPQPTALNSPQVGIDLSGEGLLVWQEPDESFVNRIYARRIFGTVPGNILQVSPATFDGHALGGAADELTLGLLILLARADTTIGRGRGRSRRPAFARLSRQSHISSQGHIPTPSSRRRT